MQCQMRPPWDSRGLFIDRRNREERMNDNVLKRFVDFGKFINRDVSSMDCVNAWHCMTDLQRERFKNFLMSWALEEERASASLGWDSGVHHAF